MLLHQKIFWLTLLMAITAIVYWPGLSGDFLFDDLPNILENKRVQIEELNLESLQKAAFSSEAGPLRRPVSMLSFALNYYAFGISPFSFKLINLIIHLLNGILIYCLAVWLLRSVTKCEESWSVKGNGIEFTALLVAAIWLLAPINLTSVLYVVQRMAVLSTFFALAGVAAYVYARHKQFDNKNTKYGILFSIVFLVCGPLAFLSKENGVLLYPLILLIELLFYKFQNLSRFDYRLLLSLYTICLVLPLIFFVGYIAHDPDWLLSRYELRDFTLAERLLTEGRVLWFYLFLIFFPTNQALALYHDDISISENITEPVTTLPATIGVIFLVIFCLVKYKKYKFISFGLLWFFIAHSLESTIFPLEIAHEHRNYLAAVGIYLSLACFLYTLASKKYIRSGLTYSLLVTIVVLFSIVTVGRAKQWSDPVTLAVMEARRSPESVRAQMAAARLFAKLANKDYVEIDGAIHYLKQASSVSQSSIGPEVSLILIAEQFDRPVKDIWIDKAKSRLTIYPLTVTDIQSLKKLIMCEAKGKCELGSQDIEDLIEAAHNNNKLPSKGKRLADLETITAEFYTNVLWDGEKANRAFRSAVKASPDNPQYHINLAKFLIATGNEREAKKILDQAEAHDTFDIYEYDIESLRKYLKK